MATSTVARRSATPIAIGVILLAILASLLPSAAVAAFPGTNGRIAYAGWYPGDEPNSDIFTILPDGSGLQRLTDNPLFEFEPSWSPDGRSLLFSRALYPESGSHVVMMDADGGDQARLAGSRATLASPSFSPSGRRVVYTKGDAIVTIGVDGSDTRRVLSGIALGAPQYSPSGRRIAFSGWPRGRRRAGIWTIRRNGSHLRRLTDPQKVVSDLADAGPDYSPDGRRIVFVRYPTDAHGGAEIYLMRADGSRERLIPQTLGFNSAAYAPDGDRIVMASEGDYLQNPSCTDLYTISQTGSDKRPITHNCPTPGEGGEGGAVSSPSWQPVPGAP